jgi:DNA-binding transcriptional MerR regulator
MENGHLRIGEAAKLAATTPGALRQGEARQRFPAPARDHRGWRTYDGATLRELLEWRRSIGVNGHDE